MTMHLVGPHMTTTKYNRKQKKPNAKLTKAHAEHEKWLKSMGVGKQKLVIQILFQTIQPRIQLNSAIRLLDMGLLEKA